MDHKNTQFIESIRFGLNKVVQESEINPPVPNLKHAAVLLPFTYRDNEIVILFTKRTNLVNSHQNQISFPGGAIEDKDNNPLGACLRETEEEIGIKQKDVEILGELNARSTSTGFYIHPFVGFIHNLEDLRINKVEVERIIYIPVIWLSDSKNSYTELFKDRNNKSHPIISYSNYDGEKVWGLTASLVKQLLDIIKK